MADNAEISDTQARRNLFASLCMMISDWAGEAAVYLDPSLADEEGDEEGDDGPDEDPVTAGNPPPTWFRGLSG